MKFNEYKQQVLSRKDLSLKQSIDEKILSLCETINLVENLVTLSSCSGRVCLLELAPKQLKKQSTWLIVTHNKSILEEFWEALGKYNNSNEVLFKQESAIIHIATDTLEQAEKLINKGKQAGFNRCGIITTKKQIVVELICSTSMQVPVFEETLRIDKEYLGFLIQKANEKQEHSWDCINKLEELIKGS